MLNAQDFRDSIKQNFDSNFPFEVFDNYIKAKFERKVPCVDIGITGTNCMSGKLFNVLPHGRWFYAWSAYCEISADVVYHVIGYLHKCGFKTELKGACGSSWNVIRVTL